MDADGPAAGRTPSEARRRRRRAGQREHRADRHPHAVRPRAQPDRRGCCRARCPRSRSSRSPAGSSAPSSSTSPTTSSSRRWASPARLHGLQAPTSTRRLGNEFADRRLPGAQHDPRRVRADRRRPPTTPPRSSTRSRRQGVEVEDDGDDVDARDPAQPRVRQPGPAPAASASARCSRASAASRSTRTTSMIDNQLRSVLFQVPCPGNPELPGRPDAAGLLQRRGRPRRDRHRARPRPRHPAATTSCGRRSGCAPKTSFTAITGESHGPASRPTTR